MSVNIVNKMTRRTSVYHERECDGRGFNALDDPHDHETGELNKREQVNATELHVTKVNVVRLILDGHQRY